MKGCCSSFDLKNICENFNCKIDQTDKGIQITLDPKDSSKKQALYDFIKAYKALFDCDCC